MLEHIVKNGENLKDIINVYKVSFDEVRNCNLHLTDFENIIPGMKIKIPLINEEVEQILDSTESFVMNYYPKVIEDIIEESVVRKVETNSLPKGKAYPGIIPSKYNK